MNIIPALLYKIKLQSIQTQIDGLLDLIEDRVFRIEIVFKILALLNTIDTPFHICV